LRVHVLRMGGVRASVGGKKVGSFELCIFKICWPLIFLQVSMIFWWLCIYFLNKLHNLKYHSFFVVHCWANCMNHF